LELEKELANKDSYLLPHEIQKETEFPQKTVSSPCLHFRRPVSSVGRTSDFREGGLGFEPQTGPTLRVLKYLRRICCLCNEICKWLDILVFSEKDDKP